MTNKEGIEKIFFIISNQLSKASSERSKFKRSIALGTAAAALTEVRDASIFMRAVLDGLREEMGRLGMEEIYNNVESSVIDEIRDGIHRG